jgi:hypothetical protein
MAVKLAAVSSTRRILYRDSKRAPIWIAAILGGFSLAYFLWVGGFEAFARPYLWPSLIITPFSLVCAFTNRFYPWHKLVWRFAQIWSAIWTFLFLVSVPFGPLGLAVLYFPLTWTLDLRVFPLIAVGIHAMYWACCCDILNETEK